MKLPDKADLMPKVARLPFYPPKQSILHRIKAELTGRAGPAEAGGGKDPGHAGQSAL
ncbi:hypothetical protein [Marinobacter sp.]|uniref:hypothetical protein n=1 Tax=Marinobacter sp. TaxID=50741 RepID=UPI002355D6A7|nr:hypothetical protein [Marinobacter sp.]